MSAQTALRFGNLNTRASLSKETKIELKSDLDDIQREYQKRVVKLQQLYNDRKARNYAMREIRRTITGMEAQMTYLKHKLGLQTKEE